MNTMKKELPEMPADLPPVPEGFVYAGKTELRVVATQDQRTDVACIGTTWFTFEWDLTGWGGSNIDAGECVHHYALRAGSEIARLNGMVYEPNNAAIGSEKTLRDEFAMAALSGILANPSFEAITPDEYANDAYGIADAMLEARKEQP